MAREDCAQLFVIYTGMLGALQMNPAQFIKLTGLIGRNLVMIRDLNQCGYQRGVSPDYPDIPSFLAWQHELVGRFPRVREVYCLGTSTGAYAAVLAGHHLHAKKVWAFAPPVPIRVEARVPYVDPKYCDLRGILAVGNGVTEYVVLYNESEEADRVSAERLRGLPGVELSPQAGQGHGVIVHLASKGLLAGLFPARVTV
jgi:hypothetical protein